MADNSGKGPMGDTNDEKLIGSLPQGHASKLPFRQVDAKTAAEELRKRNAETKKLIAGIERASVVSQEVLDLEVSI